MKIEYPTAGDIPALQALWKQCFPDPDDFIQGFFREGFSAERCRLIREGETVSSALYWFDGGFRGQKIAYLYAVATGPDCRGRGLCRTLLEDTHSLLRKRGYHAAMLLPGQPGLRKMYEKFGYRDQCQWRTFSCEAGEAIPLTEISWEEYARLRRLFLPEDGVIQEEDNLGFLAIYCRFYEGDGILLAAQKDGENLLCVELLGDMSAAPGVLAALNCRRGSFRTPGEGTQGAMFLALGEGAEKPGYFGLTFD